MPPAADDLFLKLVLELAFHQRAAWYRDRALVNALIDALAAAPLFTELRVAGPDEDLRPFASVEAARKALVTGRDDTMVLQDTVGPARRAVVRLEPDDSALTVKVWLGGPVLERQRASALDQLVALTRRLRAALAGKAGLAYGFAYPVHDREGGFAYPRARPPRRHPSLQLGSVLDLFDLAFHRSQHADAAQDGVDALLGAELPSFVHRDEADDLVALRWVDDPGDEEQLGRGAAAHAQWMSAQLPTRVEGGYNAVGDRAEDLPGDEHQVEPLTLYSPSAELGYKAVLVLPDGAVEAHAWTTACQVLAAGQLADGELVRELRLITPTRAHALALAPRAKAQGFAAVLYPDDDGQLWDPDPPGAWLGPPHP